MPHKYLPMLRYYRLIFVLVFPFTFLWGQVKIGQNLDQLNPAAILELEATDKGLLLPRLTNKQRDAIPVNESTEGLLIFNSDLNAIQYLKRQSTTASKVTSAKKYFWESANDGRILLETHTNPIKGQLYYNSQNASLHLWNGNNWVEVGGASFFEHSHIVTPTPAQQLSLIGTQLSISQGNTVDFLPLIKDNPLLVGPVGPKGPQGPAEPQGPAGVSVTGTDSQTLKNFRLE